MKKFVLFILAIVLNHTISFAQVAINENGEEANSSAILDVKSTTKGLLIPRMSAQQRDNISSPAEGLIVYVTDDSTFYYRKKNRWVKIGQGASGWEINGNLSYTDSLQHVSVGAIDSSALFQVITYKSSGSYTADRCVGGTASASENYAGKPASNAFDNNTSTYWSNDGNLPAWLQYDFGDGNGKVIAKYRIYFEAGTTDSSPNDWTFQAGNDGTTWTTLDTRTGQGWNTNGWQEYTFPNTTRYRFYRLNITDNKGSTDNYVSVNEMEMQELVYNRFPALFVDDNKVGIGTSSPSSTLDVNGGFRFTDGNEGAGKILSSDVNGDATWVDGTALNGGGWTVSGNDSYKSNGKVGIGTTIPNSKLAVITSSQDTALFIKNIINNMDDDNNHYGTMTILSGNGTGDQYGSYQSIYNYGNGNNYGNYISLLGSGTGNQYGNYIDLYGNVSGEQYGTYLYISTQGNETHYGSYIKLQGGTGTQYGNYNEISSNGSGNHYGTENFLWGNGTGEQYGSYQRIENDGDANQYGVYNILTGYGSGKHFGNYSWLWFGTGEQYGSYQKISNSENSRHFGNVNYLSGSGTGTHYGTVDSLTNGNGIQYGIYNKLSGNGNGKQYGSCQIIDNNGNGTHYGTKNYLKGSGTGKKFGTYDTIPLSAGGTHYGVYSVAEGVSNYAGYFKGRMYVSNKVGIGTDNPTQMLDVNGGFRLANGTQGNGKILVSDANGNSMWANGDTVNAGGWTVKDDTIYNLDKFVGIGTSSPTSTLSIETTNHSSASIKNSSNSSGGVFGLSLTMNNSSASSQYGIYNYFLEVPTNGNIYGLYNNLSKNTQATKYGIYNNLYNDITGDSYGIKNSLTGNGSGSKYGSYNFINNTGSGEHYGTYNYLTYMVTWTGNGNQYGTYQKIDNKGDGSHYGCYNELTGNGNGKKFGTYDSIPGSAGGTHYGVYSVAEGSSNYSGYFKGNVKITEKLKSSVSGDADMKAYIYGTLAADGSIYTNESSDGFTSSQTGTGVYKITFNSYSSDDHYLIIATAYSSNPIIITYQKSLGYFYINTFDINGNPINTILNFVVYKK